MADLDKLVEELSALTVMEATELKRRLEDAWGVEASAPMAMESLRSGRAIAWDRATKQPQPA